MRIAFASGNELAIGGERQDQNGILAPHGGLKLLALGVEHVDVASFVTNGKHVAIWRVAQAEDTVVNLHLSRGRLVCEIASLPLFAQNLDCEVGVIIARSRQFVAACRKNDGENYAADVQGAYLLIGLCVEDYHAVAGIAQAGCKFGAVRRVGHTQYLAVDLHRRKAGGRREIPQLDRLVPRAGDEDVGSVWLEGEGAHGFAVPPQ